MLVAITIMQSLGRNDLMETTKQNVSVTELRALLTAIADNGSKICIRFRNIGELWQTHHMRVLSVAEESVLLHDESHSKLVSLKFRDIMQFEIDGSIHGYKPNNHYSVKPF